MKVFCETYHCCPGSKLEDSGRIDMILSSCKLRGGAKHRQRWEA